MARKCPPGETVRQHYAHGGKLFDQDLTTPEHLLHASPIERFRLAIPETARQMTQVVVDNPGQFALITAGTVVATKAAFNLVRPRNLLEALAVMVVLQVGLPQLGSMAIERGWIKFRIRNDAGELVPLVPGKVTTDAPAAAPQA